MYEYIPLLADVFEVCAVGNGVVVDTVVDEPDPNLTVDGTVEEIAKLTVDD
jgi:hypothetical protein